MDKAHKWTDKELEKLENKITKVYVQASKELEKKSSKYFKQFAKLEKQKQKAVKKGEMTQEGYNAWREAKIMMGSHWTEMTNQAKDVLLNADKTALSYVNNELPNVYSTNYNYFASGLNNEPAIYGYGSFELTSPDTVKKLVLEGKTLLPYKEIDGKKAERWHTKTVNAQVLQGILQGESAQQLSKRLYKTGMTAKGSAIRNARTTITSAENGGRMDMLKRAKDMGIETKKVWLSAHDSRVRESHSMLDGEAEEVDHEFGNGLMFPGDSDGAPEEVYNCRCTMTYELKEFAKSEEIDHNNEYAELDMTETYYSLKEEDKSVAKQFYKTLQSEGTPSKVWSNYKTGALDTETKQKIDDILKQSETIKEKTETAHKIIEAKKKLASIESDLMTLKTNNPEVYSNIWKDDVTIADYDTKKGSIQAKKDYFEMKKSLEPDNPKWDDLLKKLKDFEDKGELYSVVNSAYNEQLKELKALERKTETAGGGSFGEGAYAQERKDNAMWAKNPKTADDALRPRTGEIWRNATDAEKDAVYDYTISYSKFNEPLRGIEYGTNRYLGVGNTDLNASYKNNGKALNAMTDLIEKSTYETDAWFNRGCRFGGMDKFFGIDEALLQNGTQEELENALLGKVVTEYGFMSVGVTKGKGFTGDILINVYAPKGSKYIYAEPFSNYGRGDGRSWDGISKQSSFGTEDEAIFQQGAMLRITKIERKSRYDTIYVDVDVVGYQEPQRWKP